MPTSLDQFVQQQLEAQGLTVKEFARRSGLGISHAYQVLRGERSKRPSAETFDAVARGLNMTPAEMAVAMGKGALEASPDETEWLALYRQLPTEHRPTVKQIVRNLAVQPTRQTPKRQAAETRMERGHEHQAPANGIAHQSDVDDSQTDNGRLPLYRALLNLFSARGMSPQRI